MVASQLGFFNPPPPRSHLQSDSPDTPLAHPQLEAFLLAGSNSMDKLPIAFLQNTRVLQTLAQSVDLAIDNSQERLR